MYNLKFNSSDNISKYVHVDFNVLYHSFKKNRLPLSCVNTTMIHVHRSHVIAVISFFEIFKNNLLTEAAAVSKLPRI